MEKPGEVPPSDSILFILVAFSCGIFIRLCLKWTKIPYTAMLLVSGGFPLCRSSQHHERHQSEPHVVLEMHDSLTKLQPPAGPLLKLIIKP
jgi:hypothetical protein